MSRTIKLVITSGQVEDIVKHGVVPSEILGQLQERLRPDYEAAKDVQLAAKEEYRKVGEIVNRVMNNPELRAEQKEDEVKVGALYKEIEKIHKKITKKNDSILNKALEEAGIKLWEARRGLIRRKS